jgi:hypothetical protein
MCCVIMILAVHPEIMVMKLEVQFGNNWNVLWYRHETSINMLLCGMLSGLIQIIKWYDLTHITGASFEILRTEMCKPHTLETQQHWTYDIYELNSYVYKVPIWSSCFKFKWLDVLWRIVFVILDHNYFLVICDIFNLNSLANDLNWGKFSLYFIVFRV